MNTNKNPIWVTIPDKKAENAQPISKKPKFDPDQVKNKVFWGLGFVALAFFSFMLVMPQKFSELFQGDLFDGNFQVIPEDGANQGGAFFGGEEEASSTEQNTTTEETQPNETSPATTSTPSNTPTPTSTPTSEVISDATPVQVTPVPAQTNPTSSTTSPTSETSTTSIPETPSASTPNADAELQSMLEALTAQLDELKADSEEKDQEIQALTDLLEQQAIHSAAKPDPVQNTTSSDSTENSSSQTPPTQNAVSSNSGFYKPNTHTVLITPHEVLNQNQKTKADLIAKNAQASVGSAQAAPSANPNLSYVQSQPTTGPLESLMLAFILTSLAVLGYGIYSNFKFNSKA